MKYTYRYTEPSVIPPFKTRIRYTRGRYLRTTESTGVFGFRYAVFATRAREVWIPLHDLTPESKAAINIFAKGTL